MGTGNAAADQYGGDRTAAEDAFTSAVVALDMHTGNTRWHVNTCTTTCGTTTWARNPW